MFRWDVVCAAIVLSAAPAWGQHRAPAQRNCAAVAGHPRGCFCQKCFARQGHPQGCYCAVCKPCPEPAEPELAPQPEGAYVQGPASGEFAGESVSVGLTGFGLRFPELNLQLPTLRLPSIVLYRRQPEMYVESSRAPYVERGAQEYGKLLGESEPPGEPEAAPQEEKKEQPEYKMIPMPCPVPCYQQPPCQNPPPKKCLQPQNDGGGQIPYAPAPSLGQLSPREIQLMQQIQAEQQRIQRLEGQIQQMQLAVEASLHRLEENGNSGEIVQTAQANADAVSENRAEFPQAQQQQTYQQTAPEPARPRLRDRFRNLIPFGRR